MSKESESPPKNPDMLKLWKKVEALEKKVIAHIAQNDERAKWIWRIIWLLVLLILGLYGLYAKGI